MKAQLCLFNMEKVFSKSGQLHFLSEQGKPEKGEKLPAKQPPVLESPQPWWTSAGRTIQRRIPASTKKNASPLLSETTQKS